MKEKKPDDHWFNMWLLTTDQGVYLKIGNQWNEKEAIEYASSHCRNTIFISAKLTYDPTGIFRKLKKSSI